MPEIHGLVVNGLSVTKEWKNALKLSNQTNISSNILIRKSLRENEFDLVRLLLNRITGLKKEYQHLSNKTIISFVKYFERYPDQISQNIEKMFITCEKTNKLFDEKSTQELRRLLSKHGHHAHITTIDYS